MKHRITIPKCLIRSITYTLISKCFVNYMDPLRYRFFLCVTSETVIHYKNVIFISENFKRRQSTDHDL